MSDSIFVQTFTDSIFIQNCNVFNKELCYKCRNIANWYLRSNGFYYCDDCVSRNCDCNWMWYPSQEPEGVDWVWAHYKNLEDYSFLGVEITETSKPFQYLDEKRRPFPCTEYDFSEEGYSTLDDN